MSPKHLWVIEFKAVYLALLECGSKNHTLQTVLFHIIPLYLLIFKYTIEMKIHFCYEMQR